MKQILTGIAMCFALDLCAMDVELQESGKSSKNGIHLAQVSNDDEKANREIQQTVIHAGVIGLIEKNVAANNVFNSLSTGVKSIVLELFENQCESRGGNIFNNGAVVKSPTDFSIYNTLGKIGKISSDVSQIISLILQGAAAGWPGTSILSSSEEEYTPSNGQMITSLFAIVTGAAAFGIEYLGRYYANKYSNYNQATIAYKAICEELRYDAIRVNAIKIKDEEV